MHSGSRPEGCNTTPKEEQPGGNTDTHTHTRADSIQSSGYTCLHPQYCLCSNISLVLVVQHGSHEQEEAPPCRF